MTPRRIAIPKDGAVYRGAPWVLRLNADWDISGDTLTMNFAVTLNTTPLFAAVTDDSNQSAPTNPYATFTLDGTTTGGIDPNITSLEWEIDTTSDAWFCGSVPVRGRVDEA